MRKMKKVRQKIKNRQKIKKTGIQKERKPERQKEERSLATKKNFFSAQAG